MSFVEEKNWLKKYWWIILIVVLIILVFGFIGSLGVFSASKFSSIQSEGAGSYDSARYQGLSPVSNTDFAPEVEERQLIKTSNIAMETKRGKFFEVQDNVNSIIKTSGAYILSQNFQTLGSGSQTYNTNTYSIKIETSKYDGVVAQLKNLGGVVSFSETATDVTGAISNKQVELAAEKERLRRYEQLVSSTGSLSEKLTLTDRIFEEDRRIKYIEAALSTTQQDVAYSTISLRLSEKAPMLYGVSFVGFGSLIKTLVGSVNALLYFISAILPWLVAIGIVIWIISWIRKKMSR